MNPEYRDLRHQRIRKNFFFETSMDGFLLSNCASLEQECILLQPDVGVDNEKETIATTQQVAVCEEFARPTKKRQKKKTTARTTN